MSVVRIIYTFVSIILLAYIIKKFLTTYLYNELNN